MNISDAGKLCSKHGATLLNYRETRFAMLQLSSGEQVLISVGTGTAKILARRRILGWLVPRCIATRSLVEWEARYREYNKLHRVVCRGMVLYGLLNLIAPIGSVDGIRLAWPALRNPLEIASLGLFRDMCPDLDGGNDRKKT